VENEGAPVEIDAFVVLDICADAAHLTPVRRDLLSWLRGAGVPDRKSHDITLAAYEALANSVEHAYGDGDIHVAADATIGIRVTRRLDSGVVEVRVWDQGVWNTTDGGRTRGRGLPLIHALADHVTITSDGGTTIEMRFDGDQASGTSS
jgi:serine/threonine-protein kinase RsbW